MVCTVSNCVIDVLLVVMLQFDAADMIEEEETVEQRYIIDMEVSLSGSQSSVPTL